MHADTATIARSGEPEGVRLGAMDRALLARPLEYLLVDHLRQRNLCALLEQVAGARALDPVLTEKIADHISGDFAIHGIDDEEDLFPLVRRRSQPEDRVEEILGLLSGERAAEDRLASNVAESLRSAVAARASVVDEGLRARLRLFADRLRRHLTVENALIMPLAGARLTDIDRRGLARRMAARRGIHLSQEIGRD